MNKRLQSIIIIVVMAIVLYFFGLLGLVLYSGGLFHMKILKKEEPTT